MTTTPRSQKDKPHIANLRLAPRPTAASAARAAHNATNRNLMLPHSQKQSPTRTPNSPTTVKAKYAAPRNPPKCDSKCDLKIPVREEQDPYIVEDLSTVKTEDLSDKNINYSNADDSVGIDRIVNLDDKFDINTLRETGNENDGCVPEKLPRSRPHTPHMSSCPPTPRSLQSSRPQTPRLPSRPTTPVHPRHTTPTSRPNTPQGLPTPNKPTTPVYTIVEKISTPNIFSSSSNSQMKDDKDIKTVYALKQKQFQRMKKELDFKQHAVLEVFECLRSLCERMSQQGMGCGEGPTHQEIVMFNVADWATDELSQLCRDVASPVATEGATELISAIVPLDECAIAEMESKANSVPARFAELCLQAFTARQELVDWVKTLIEKYPDIGSNSVEEISQYNVQGFELCESLREIKSSADSAIDGIAQLFRQTRLERRSLATVGESLVREIARLQQKVDAATTVISELRQAQTDNDVARSLEETRRELEEERAARVAAKDKLSTTESQLKQTRIRVSKMDRQLREAEASIASLTGTVKTLEDQSRQREVQLEARARKLKESVKTGEVVSGQISQQRDALQIEVSELKDQIETLIAQHKSVVLDLTTQLKDVKTVLDEQKRMTEQEVEQKLALQNALAESDNTIEQLRTKVTELENSHNPDLPTEREMDLWAELQATKDTLRITEDEVAMCKREKVKFLETMTKITDTDDEVGMQQKLAAELLSKEEIVNEMQIKMREMTKHIKLNEQKVAQYEQYMQNLQAHRLVADCQEAPNGINYRDMQQEIMNLRMSLLEAVHQKEELTELLVQKEQQLDQQEKKSRSQARVIKVREELINMLKNKETEQSRELATLQQDLEHRMSIVGDVNKQIAAKAEEIQELFTTLENKQQQIHRLEKIVLALEEQQRRAQAQRTRHEEKIAALEHELAAGGTRRERKFLFF